jgi:glycosyltransferase involved in cell wall biosynthesis
MVHGLAQMGIDVHIAATDDDGPGKHLSVPLGQPRLQDGVTYWYFHRQTGFYTFSWPLTQWLAQNIHNYDLVDIHALFSYPSVSAAVCASNNHVPYILRPQGMLNQWGMQQRRPWLKQISFHLIERRLLAQAAAIQFTCEHERIQAAMLGVQTPSSLIPLPLDLTPFEQLPPHGQFRGHYPGLVGKTLLLFLSRLDPKKGLDLLLPAFARTRQELPGVVLVLAGSGDPNYENTLRDQVRALSLEQDVIFAGFLEGEAKLAALVDSDLFILPSHSENFGLAVAEAMAAGLPVIISDQVGVAHEVAQAQAGLVTSCTVDAIASAVLQLLSDADCQGRMIANAYRLVRERFAVDAVSRSLVELYHDVTTGIGVHLSQ